MKKCAVIKTDNCIVYGNRVNICSDVFGFDENEEMLEVMLPEGDIEGCIEETIRFRPADCLNQGYTEYTYSRNYS